MLSPSLRTQGPIESVRARLPALAITRLGSLLTRAHGSVAGLTFVLQLGADEAGYDLDVERGAVVEIRRVRRLESRNVSPIGRGREGDGGVAAGAEVCCGT